MASQLSNYREAFSSASDYYGNQAIRFRGVHKSQETKYRKLEALSKIMERHAAELAPPSGLSLEILAREAGKTEAFEGRIVSANSLRPYLNTLRLQINLDLTLTGGSFIMVS